MYYTCSKIGSKHPGGVQTANLESISHRCHPMLVACVWELTKETINLPLGCLQGGFSQGTEWATLRRQVPKPATVPFSKCPQLGNFCPFCWTRPVKSILLSQEKLPKNGSTIKFHLVLCWGAPSERRCGAKCEIQPQCLPQSPFRPRCPT